MRIPIFRVDPTVIGPIELVRRRYRELKAWAQQPIISVALILGSVALVGGAWMAEISIPEIPNWVIVALLSMIPGAALAYKYGAELAEGIHEPETVYLSELNVYSGDQRLIKLAPERFSDTTVVSHQWDPGEEPMSDAIVGRERLKRVTVNGTPAYEVDIYDPVLNVAVTSSQAGRSSLDIREDHAKIDMIRTDLERQVDTVYEVLSRETQVIRQATSMQTNKIVAAAQDSELPEEAEIGSHRTMADLFEQEGLDRDLLDQQLDIDDGDPEMTVPSGIDIEDDNVDIEVTGP